MGIRKSITFSGSRVWIPAVLCAVSAACQGEDRGPFSPDDGPEALGSVEIVASEITLGENEIRTLALEGEGAGDPDALRWWSDGPMVAGVEGGVVSGVGAGVTFVHVRAGSHHDSVRVRVRFSDLATGGMAVRIPGQEEAHFEKGWTVWFRQLAADDERGCCSPRQSTGLTHVWSATDSRDVVLNTWFLGRPDDEREHTFESFGLGGEPDAWYLDGDEGVWIQTLSPRGPDFRHMYLSTGEVRIESDNSEEEIFPEGTALEAAGLRPGDFSGTIDFKAAGFLLQKKGATDWDIVDQLSDSLESVFIEFDTNARQWLQSDGYLHVSGSSFGHPRRRRAHVQARSVGEGVVLEVDRTYKAPSIDEMLHVRLEVWIPEPTEGTITVPVTALEDATGDDRFDSRETWAHMTFKKPMNGSSDAFPLASRGLAGSGEIRLNLAKQGRTDEHFGLLRGEAELHMILTDGDGVATGEEARVSTLFFAGVLPGADDRPFPPVDRR